MKKGALVAVAAAAGLGLSACGGGASASDPGSLKLMQIILPPVNGLDQQAGVKAGIAAVNAAGGINGQKLQYEFCSTGAAPVGDPNTTANCGAKAVQDDVTALVGSFMVFPDQVYPLLEQKKIANIQPLGAVNIDNTSPASFALGNGYTILSGQGLALAEAGCKKVGLITRDGLPTDPEIVGTFAAGAKQGGAQVVEPVLVPNNTLDFNAAVAKLASEGADCIGDGFPTTAETQPILQAVHSIGGSNMKVSVNASVLSQDALKTLGDLGNGVLAVDSAYVNAPASSTDTAHMTPEEKQMIDDIKKYAPEGLAANHAAWGGYVAVKIFQAAAEQLVKDKKDITAANITAALQNLKLQTGIVPPLDFSTKGPGKEPRIFNSKVNVFEVQNGNLVAVSPDSKDVSRAIAGF